jgi:hypothetical protein
MREISDGERAAVNGGLIKEIICGALWVYGTAYLLVTGERAKPPEYWCENCL